MEELAGPTAKARQQAVIRVVTKEICWAAGCLAAPFTMLRVEVIITIPAIMLIGLLIGSSSIRSAGSTAVRAVGERSFFYTNRYNNV